MAMAKLFGVLALFFFLGSFAVQAEKSTSPEVLHDLLMQYAHTIGSPCTESIKKCSEMEMTEITMTVETVCRIAKQLNKCVISTCAAAAKYPFMIENAIDVSLQQLGFKCEKPKEKETLPEVGIITGLIDGHDQDASILHKMMVNYGHTLGSPCTEAILSCSGEMLRELELKKETVCKVAEEYSDCVMKKCDIAAKFSFSIKGAIETSLHQLGFKCDHPELLNHDDEFREYGNLLGNPAYDIAYGPKGNPKEVKVPRMDPQDEPDSGNGQASSKMGGTCAALLLVALVIIRNIFSVL